MDRNPRPYLLRDSALEVEVESFEAEGFALEASLEGIRCAAPLRLVVEVVEAPEELHLPLDWDCDRFECSRWELDVAADLKAAWLAGAPLP